MCTLKIIKPAVSKTIISIATILYIYAYQKITKKKGG